MGLSLESALIAESLPKALAPARLTVAPTPFIGGEFLAADEREQLEVFDPARGTLVARLQQANADDVESAVRSSRAAIAPGGPWSRLRLVERAAAIRRLRDQVDEHGQDLAALACLETGKILRECEGEVVTLLSHLEYFERIAERLGSDVLSTDADALALTQRSAIGVTAAIVPWNYPIALIAVKVPVALAMGNAVILKAAEQTPLTAQALAWLAQQAELPPGALNVLPGTGPVTGAALVNNPGLDHISFTGSTPVGREIGAVAGRNLIPATLELGGKSPQLIFPDCDLERAIDTAMWSFSINQGQLCSAATRLLVDRRVADEVTAALASRAEAIRIGDPTDPTTDLGAVISVEQLSRIADYVELGSSEGASLLAGGGKAEPAGFEGGSYFSPTIFGDVSNRSRIAQEEIFGPVLTILTFETEAEAVALANDVAYGLNAALWTNDLNRALRVARAIESGSVYINCFNEGNSATSTEPWKGSGVGSEGGDRQALEMTRTKLIWASIDDR